MDSKKYNEEQMREYACIGDQLAVENLVLIKMVNVNSQNTVNNWTALHWAAKRGHAGVTEFLVNNGADRSIKTNTGKTALHLATNESVRTLLKDEASDSSQQSETDDQLPIVPNYLAHPQFPYTSAQDLSMPEHEKRARVQLPVTAPQPVAPSSASQQLGLAKTGTNQSSNATELVLKVRVAHDHEKDFIEVELDRPTLTFESLVSTMCHELHVNAAVVHKIRKLPNTIVRKDKDVWRLSSFQELELVLSSSSQSPIITATVTTTSMNDTTSTDRQHT